MSKAAGMMVVAFVQLVRHRVEVDQSCVSARKAPDQANTGRRLGRVQSARSGRLGCGMLPRHGGGSAVAREGLREVMGKSERLHIDLHS